MEESVHQENSSDIVQKIIREALLKVEGVENIAIQRTKDGFHVHVLPKSRETTERLRERIHSAVIKDLPNLHDYLQISIEEEEQEHLKIASKSRIELAGIDVSSDRKGRFSITVKLCRKESQRGEAHREGVYITENVMRLASEATLEAALSYFPEESDGAVIGTKLLEMGDKNLVVVLLTLILKEGKVSASGSACVRNETHIAAAMATLKAINRYLEFYGKD